MTQARRRRWRKLLSGVVLPLLGAQACRQIAGIHEGYEAGSRVLCGSLSDCQASAGECRVALACDEGVCTFAFAADGAPLTQQIPSDCAEVQCNGLGGAKILPLPTDTPDDGEVCTVDACDGTTEVHVLLAEMPCYTGPEGTKGVGLCVGGVQRCDDAGNLLEGCEGEVVPGIETCASMFDEDCDGLVNEEGPGCACAPGCYPGPEATSGKGLCRPGTQACDPDGEGFGPCEGAQSPLPEDCAGSIVDEDCDGEVNEEGCACACAPGDVKDCYTGLPENAGEGICALGEQTCNPDGASFGPCVGSTAPEPETCDARKLDEDCDGEVNEEGADCTCGYAAQIWAGGLACALLDSAHVKCWGSNSYGALGLGGPMNHGDEPNDMGDNLPVLDLGAGATIAMIAAGPFSACARLHDDRVKCWGNNELGQLGLGDVMHRGDDPNEMGDDLPALDLGAGEKVTAIIAGYQHTCALLSDSRVKCWGDNALGQLGLGDTSARGDDPGEMGDDLPALDLGAGKVASAIAASYGFDCALLADGAVKCWGLNKSGQLGLGDVEARGDEPGEMGDNLPAVKLFSGCGGAL